MIHLNGAKLALMAAAVARVASNQNHKFPGDNGVNEISAEIGAVASVYDHGLRGKKQRMLRFDFPSGESIEFEVGPQPELVIEDPRPEGDPDPTPPVALAQAA